MATTSWCDLLAAIQERMMNGDVDGVQQVNKGDKSITYRSWAELERKYHWVEARCNDERGLKVRRAYAKNGGRG
jgi:hypothetical protein